MLRSGGERPQNQQVERALRKVDAFLCHSLTLSLLQEKYHGLAVRGNGAFGAGREFAPFGRSRLDLRVGVQTAGPFDKLRPGSSLRSG